MKTPMISRRSVLRGGLAGLATLASGPGLLVRPAHAMSKKPVLVSIFLRGAVDGLNMVVPYQESNYYTARRTIAVDRPGSGTGAALDLDGRFGLHPAMSALHGAYLAGELAIVHACGSHDESRSHFDAQDFMETGQPGNKSARDGWIARHLDALPGSGDLRAVALSSVTPRALSGTGDVYASSSLVDLDLGGSRDADIARAAIERMYEGRSDFLGHTVQDTLANFELFTDIGANPYAPANGATYPDSTFGNQMREVAQVLKADVGVEVAFLNIGGWDTHSNEGQATGQLPNLLRDLSDTMAAFRIDMGDEMANICTLTMSEFGRTVGENGSGGTDHGHGTAMMVMGGTTRGGRVYGDWPGLAPAELYEGRDLAVTTDFRLLFGEIVDRHLRNPDVDAVFPGFTYRSADRLGVIA